MTKRPKKHQHPFFMMPKEITSGHYRLSSHGNLIETKLSKYLGPYAINTYNLIGNKQGSDKVKNQRLICIAADAAHLMSRPIFSKSVFRCWAYRLIAVHEWGGTKQKNPAQYQLINKWRTLIRMPERLEQIHELVAEYEKVKRLKSNPALKKFLHLKNIKSKIRDIIV